MEKEQGKAQKTRAPKKVTAQRLHNQALYYLDRFPTTVGKMRNVLINKCKNPAEFHNQDWEEILILIESEIERLTRVGILNDALYAQSRARILSRRGKSLRMIKASLADFKIDEENIENAVTELGATAEQVDLLSAVNYVRRRKFGPYRNDDTRSERREKDMAALARAGFGYDVVKKVIDVPTIEQLENLGIEED